jgi:hypothetical protein
MNAEGVRRFRLPANVVYVVSCTMHCMGIEGSGVQSRSLVMSCPSWSVELAMKEKCRRRVAVSKRIVGSPPPLGTAVCAIVLPSLSSLLSFERMEGAVCHLFMIHSLFLPTILTRPIDVDLLLFSLSKLSGRGTGCLRLPLPVIRAR